MPSSAASGRGGRDQKGGAGLGLDIAARTVVAHGGAISVGEAPEGGAVFTMEFETTLGTNARGKLAFREAHPAPQPLQDCDLLAAVRRL